MELKHKAIELRRLLASGRLPEDNPQLALFIGGMLNFFLGLLMAGAQAFGVSGPFGVAAVAQAGPHLGGLMCTMGAAAGYLLSLGLEGGISYVSASVLVFTAAYIFQETKLAARPWLMPAAAALFTFLAGVMEYMGFGGSLPVLALQSVLAGLYTVIIREALIFSPPETEQAEKRRAVAVVLLLCCAFASLARLELFGVLSLGRFLALLVLFTAAGQGGTLPGAAVGAALGLAMDTAAGQAPYYAALYAFTGLVSGLFSQQKRLVYLLSAVLADAALVFILWDTVPRVSALYEGFAASVVFMLLPEPLIKAAGSPLRGGQLSACESGLRRYTARRLEQMSGAFRELYETVDKQMGADINDEDPAKIFDRASQNVCNRCKRRGLCWNVNYMDTLAVFNDLSGVIQSRGLVLATDLPPHFVQSCRKPEALVAAVNAELRAKMFRQRFKNRLEENRQAAYSQFAGVSDILLEVSEELINAYGPDVLAQRRLSRYLCGLSIDADVSVFRDRSGRLHIIIEGARLRALTRETDYLDRLSGVLGVRLCRFREDSLGEGRLLLLEAEPLSASVGIASMKKQGESVSGDRGTYFKTDQGTLCVILSDGMGSGEEAAKESGTVVRILERFLKAGMEPQAAMRLLNSMMLLKNGENWGFATVDLLCVDLFSGEAGFYKYGAAPSYVSSAKGIRRVHSQTLAAGMAAGEGTGPDVVRLRLRPGCLALIASDGVLAGSGDEWLRELLRQGRESDTKDLAREAMESALRQYGCSDDMTVLAVRLEKRE